MHETRLILQTGSYIIMHAVINSIGFLPLILSPSAPYLLTIFSVCLSLIQSVGIFYLFFFFSFIQGSPIPDPLLLASVA
ncbi:myo-inositol oxygenase [Histoplasma capsulatum var. duboisii H88]|uniref:Myo-inositol oxygenase n=1 Tax=Ajellomyces capsulatus (strain H88) TaxID=544711 RepID=A0A8A1LML3_AJEC8|nr:myo-inositol oxygenase [Histoplasma capsulatum var. duboisii H88]